MRNGKYLQGAATNGHYIGSRLALQFITVSIGIRAMWRVNTV